MAKRWGQIITDDMTYTTPEMLSVLEGHITWELLIQEWKYAVHRFSASCVDKNYHVFVTVKYRRAIFRAYLLFGGTSQV